MTVSDDESESLAQFLESEVLSEVSDQEERREEEGAKGERNGFNEKEKAKGQEQEQEQEQEKEMCSNGSSNKKRRIESGILSKIPPEIFFHILKFLSSEDLMACSMVCRFLNFAASDESLWRRLYCLRWGILPPSKKLSESAWKKLYIQRDEEEMVKLVRNCQPEFKEYYIQMHASKRSQAPLPSQVKDDQIILDKTIADEVSSWKSSKGLTDKVFTDHACSGETCSFYQIGDVFVCEKTGNVHGLCFDRLLSPSEMEPDPVEGTAVDEAEPFMGSGRFARAYMLGYNCDDENELEATLRFC